jgi:hypothetical protein
MGEVKLIAAQDILRPHKHIVRLTYIGHADGEVKLSDEHTGYTWLRKEELMNIEPVDPIFKEVLEGYLYT